MNPYTGIGNRLLLDTNVLVLYVVGCVNPRRIETFKRTSSYRAADFDLLLRTLEKRSIYTVPHVLAEVSNLTDLGSAEGFQARQVLRETISIVTEVPIPSLQAALNPSFPGLGLTDAAIKVAAREHQCVVLTDDLDLYLSLLRDGIEVLNFTHIRALSMGV